NLVITDAMPAGLVFQSVNAIDFGANISGNAVDNGVPFTNVNNTLTFNFGTLINHGDNQSNADDDITIDIIARAGAGNLPGTQLTNDAHLTATSPSFPNVSPVERDASEVVEVVAPDPTITKSASVATGDAGDEVTYTVVVTPGGSGPLLNSLIFDPL